MMVSAPFLVIAPTLLASLTNGAQIWGAILSAIGIGSVLGAFGIIRRKPKRPLIVIELATIMLAAPIFLLAEGAPILMIVGSSLLYGFGIAVLNVLLITVIQREVIAHVLSRVMSIVQLIVIVFTSFGYLLAGPGASWLGPNMVLFIGAGILCVSVIISLMIDKIWKYHSSEQ